MEGGGLEEYHCWGREGVVVGECEVGAELGSRVVFVLFVDHEHDFPFEDIALVD